MIERIKITKELLVDVAKFLFTSNDITKARSEYLVAVCEQILEDQKTINHFKNRWEKINVDLDAPEDCVKMCITLAHYFRDGSLYD